MATKETAPQIPPEHRSKALALGCSWGDERFLEAHDWPLFTTVEAAHRFGPIGVAEDVYVAIIKVACQAAQERLAIRNRSVHPWTRGNDVLPPLPAPPVAQQPVTQPEPEPELPQPKLVNYEPPPSEPKPAPVVTAVTPRIYKPATPEDPYCDLCDGFGSHRKEEHSPSGYIYCTKCRGRERRLPYHATWRNRLEAQGLPWSEPPEPAPSPAPEPAQVACAAPTPTATVESREDSTKTKQIQLF